MDVVKEVFRDVFNFIKQNDGVQFDLQNKCKGDNLQEKRGFNTQYSILCFYTSNVLYMYSCMCSASGSQLLDLVIVHRIGCGVKKKEL